MNNAGAGFWYPVPALPIVKYYLGIMLKAYNEFENRVEHLKYHNLSKPDRIKAVIDNKVGAGPSTGYVRIWKSIFRFP